MITLTDNAALLTQLSALSLIEVDSPILSYDNLKRQLIYTFIGRNAQSQEYVIEIRLKRTDLYRIELVTVFSPFGVITPINITTPLTITAIAGTTFNLTVGGVTETPPEPQTVVVPSYVSILKQQNSSPSLLLNSPGVAYIYSNNSYTTLILSL